MGNSEARFQRQVGEVVAEVLGDKAEPEWCNKDDFSDMKSLQKALRKAGVESCNLIVGIDFTGSNKTQGKDSYHAQNLHMLDSPHGPNPYELALGAMARALAPFDDDGILPAFIFGDVETKHFKVRSLNDTGRDCRGIDGQEGILAAYRKAAGRTQMSGPTSFAPLIDRAVEIVRQSDNQLHILLILADGLVSEVMDCLSNTKAAIVRAASHPLSIVMVGVGDGPWDEMESFDNDLPQRAFDNFQFLAFTKFQALLSTDNAAQRNLADAAFAVCALQEVPPQFKAMHRLGLLGPREDTCVSAAPTALALGDVDSSLKRGASEVQALPEQALREEPLAKRGRQ